MNPSRVHRLLRLIVLLQSRQATGVRELMTELGVSRRTLFRDLNMLQLAGIPYHHDPGSGYRLASTFFLPPVNLTVPETLGLLLLGKTAAATRSRPLLEPALAAIQKLTATVPEPIRSACTEMMGRVSVDPGAQAWPNGGGETTKCYYMLQRCIDEARECLMVYTSPVEPEPLRCTLRPLALHFATRSWYVLGQTDIHGQETRLFKLARIGSLEPQQSLFVRPRDFSPADKLGQAWQLIPEGKLYDIVLEFSAKVATNVSEVRWHASQRHECLEDGRCRMTFRVDGLGEIAWWICGYAGEVRVIQPQALRDRVREMHRAAAGRQEDA
ncbi:MAG: WYL domain-containing protein [Planctomycetota bacterium]|nr:WYL domain-containing protein [Planctomycetota bacterium]